MYEKSWDLFDLAYELQNRADGLSLDDIQKKYNVSLRTAQRMCAALRDYFPHMEETQYSDGKSKRWRISQRTLDLLFSLSSQDISTLRSSIVLLRQHNLHDKADSLRSLENKLASLVQSEKRKKWLANETETLLKMEGLAFRPGPSFHLDPELLRVLRTALLNKKQIRIKYYNKGTEKYSYNTLEPYGLLYGERNHYLLARHSDNYYGDAIRHFILYHIHDIVLLDCHFQLPSDFSLSNHCRHMFGAFNEPPFDVEWRFDKQVANEAKHYIFHPSQKIVKNTDGSITVTFRAGGAVEMSWHLYMWGDSVDVIKPTDFWQRVAQY